MAEIVLARIDDRLIHGQVMTAWVHYCNGNTIVIVDDETAEDDFLISVLEMSIPSGIKLHVFNVDDGAEYLKNVKGNQRIIILAKRPKVFLDLLKKGVSLESVIIGGMGASKERSRFYKNISASEEEKNELREIIGMGVKVNIHIIPDQDAVNVEQLL